MNNKPVIYSTLMICIVVILTGCGAKVSRFSYDESYQINQANQGDNCYDASILLGTNLQTAKDISKKVVIAIDATILEESLTFFRAQRNRHVGLFVGSGGEQLFVTLQEVSDESTFVSVATKTGFVGGAGQKAWSCKIVDEMATMASK